jgi:hypothetical protein
VKDQDHGAELSVPKSVQAPHVALFAAYLYHNSTLAMPARALADAVIVRGLEVCQYAGIAFTLLTGAALLNAQISSGIAGAAS